MDKDLLNKIPVKIDDIPSMTNKGGDIKVMISPKTVNSTKLILGIVVLKPGEVLVEHLHDYGEETFFVTEGSGTIYIDGNEITIKKDNAVIIPQGCTHKLINTGEVVLRLVFATAPLAPTAQKGDRVINKN